MLFFHLLLACSNAVNDSDDTTPTWQASIPASCRDYLSCAEQLSSSVSEYQAILDTHGEDGSCWGDDAVLDVCLAQCDEGRIDYAYNHLSSPVGIPDACWPDSEPCAAFDVGDTLCPESKRRIGFPNCEEEDPREVACAAEAIIVCEPGIEDRVGACFGLPPGRHRPDPGTYSPAVLDFQVTGVCPPDTYVPLMSPLSVQLTEEGEVIVRVRGFRAETVCREEAGEFQCDIAVDPRIAPTEIHFYWEPDFTGSIFTFADGCTLKQPLSTRGWY